MNPDNSPVLGVQNLAVEYRDRRGRVNRVIEDVSFNLAVGETLALVGESGSGKSTIGKAVLGLEPAAAGRIFLEGGDITSIRPRERRRIAPRLQAIFQNPYGSLNPALTVGQSLSEPILAARGGSLSAARRDCAEILERVGMPTDTLSRFPADFSGGQRQRIAIARAAVLRPAVIVCDEPTSALDVTTQARVLDLLAELRNTLGMAYLFITHDLAVVREFADRVVVLSSGEIVEEGGTSDVCERPKHPYTQRLVRSAPVPDPILQRQRRAAAAAAAAVG